MLNYPLTLIGSEPGKNVVVLAGVHGNEPCGVNAFDRVVPDLQIQRGSVTFEIGNPDALSQGKRFIDANLNRMFLPDSELSERARASSEYRRSRELIPLLESADTLLDIHASNTPNAIPFIICEPGSFKTALSLPGSIISSGWDRLEPGGTDYLVNKKGGIAICIECGYAGDPASDDRAVKAIEAFLVSMGSIERADDIYTEAPSKKFIEVYAIHHTTNNFRPERHFSDFEQVKKGEVLGMDGETTICADKDAYVVFVRTRENPGEEAFLLAHEIKGPA